MGGRGSAPGQAETGKPVDTLLSGLFHCKTGSIAKNISCKDSKLVVLSFCGLWALNDKAVPSPRRHTFNPDVK